VFRLRHYVNRLRDGGINPRPRLAVVTEGAATALVDGDNAGSAIWRCGAAPSSRSRRRPPPASAGSACATATMPDPRRGHELATIAGELGIEALPPRSGTR
jgi:hypothetical protein